MALQGYEPLLPSSIPYTETILTVGRALQIPSSIVTNGVYLRDAVEMLRRTAPAKIAVSIDAADPATHDRIRGVAGTWHAAIDGLRAASARLDPASRLAVISVVFPGKAERLLVMPALLKELGIAHWILSPLVQIKGGAAKAIPASAGRIFEDILALHDAAQDAGIRLTVDDGLDHLQVRIAAAQRPALQNVEFRAFPSGVEIFRLVPSGHCSFGDEILAPLDLTVRPWRPGEIHAADFLDLVKAQACTSADRHVA